MENPSDISTPVGPIGRRLAERHLPPTLAEAERAPLADEEPVEHPKAV